MILCCFAATSLTQQSPAMSERIKRNQAAKALRIAAIAARRRFYAALKEIDGLLAAKPDEAAEKLRPYLEAASKLPE